MLREEGSGFQTPSGWAALERGWSRSQGLAGAARSGPTGPGLSLGARGSLPARGLRDGPGLRLTGPCQRGCHAAGAQLNAPPASLTNGTIVENFLNDHDYLSNHLSPRNRVLQGRGPNDTEVSSSPKSL